MNPEYKKYILENIGKKSITHIAGDLHLKEKVVRRFLEKEKAEDLYFNNLNKKINRSTPSDCISSDLLGHLDVI